MVCMVFEKANRTCFQKNITGKLQQHKTVKNNFVESGCYVAQAGLKCSI